MAEAPSITVLQLASGAWLVEPANLPTAVAEVQAFVERDDAAVYAAQLGAKHQVTTIVLPPNRALDS